ncbi:MAG: hypothetical protein JSS14_03180 [Proteobacteria bacterium]|nr:hypothetical protein [Pseudomonadota bacterium]
MAERSFDHLTRGAYAPQPRRSRIAGLGRWMVCCAACLALGAAAAIGYARAPGPACVPCTTAPQDDQAQLELTRTRLALQQEVAARTAVQETADASAAEVRRLSEELRFLRGQTPQPRR